MLTWTSLIGQFVHTGAMWGMALIVILSGYKFYFIIVHDNLVQDSSNKKSIFILLYRNIKKKKIGKTVDILIFHAVLISFYCGLRWYIFKELSTLKAYYQQKNIILTLWPYTYVYIISTYNFVGVLLISTPLKYLLFIVYV